MEHIDFVLWMVLYPIASGITNYLGTKSRILEGLPPYGKTTTALASLTTIVIWIYVATLLY
jgi:hypothetical protein